MDVAKGALENLSLQKLIGIIILYTLVFFEEMHKELQATAIRFAKVALSEHGARASIINGQFSISVLLDKKEHGADDTVEKMREARREVMVTLRLLRECLLATRKRFNGVDSAHPSRIRTRRTASGTWI